MMYSSASLDETKKIANQVAKEIPKPCVVAFFGDLGAGKTTFIRAFAEHFGIEANEVCSPTFQYLNIYKGHCTLYHFDLYRLQGVDDFLAMGFEEFFALDGIFCIEWAERIEAILPKNCIRVEIGHDCLQRRHIYVKNSVE